ncbi:hypothetical protein TeGR_g8644, partial [Tetraparma gracilis]
YTELIKDPIGTVKNLYKQLGYPFTPEYEAALKEYIAENERERAALKSKGSKNLHTYTLEEFGLEKEQVEDNLSWYKKKYFNPPATTSASPPAEASHATLSNLIRGYQRFRSSDYVQHANTFSALANSQAPPVMVVACADSRVDPSVVFNAAPGELFCLRNVANLVPPYCPDGKLHGVSSGLEYAVNVLKVQHIVVMQFLGEQFLGEQFLGEQFLGEQFLGEQFLGVRLLGVRLLGVRLLGVRLLGGHGKCGGVCACLQGADLAPELREFVGPWVAMLKDAREKVLKSGTINPQYALELEGIELSLRNLMSFPFVKRAVEEGRLQLHGAW